MQQHTDIKNPFQSGNIRKLEYFAGVAYSEVRASEFDEFYRLSQMNFGEAVRNKSVTSLVMSYQNDVRQVFGSVSGLTKIEKNILKSTLSNLVYMFSVVLNSKRCALSENNSVKIWNLDLEMILRATTCLTSLVDSGAMGGNGVITSPYDLKEDRLLFSWVNDVLKPIIHAQVGEGVTPIAHIRMARAIDNGLRHGRYVHQYANYHWDASTHSFPLIIYLDSVGERDGPFTYVDGSDKIEQNYVLRAIHTAVSSYIHTDGIISPQAVASLPPLLRHGDRVGFYTGEELFEKNNVVDVLGEAGRAILFDGFHLVHDGGYPMAGHSRSALFESFRFPRQKLWRIKASVAKRYLTLRESRMLS